MNAIRKFLSNKWIKFGIVAFIYLLFVIWIGNYWLLLGLAIVFDIYITKKVKWAFWKKQYKEGEKRNSLLDWLDAAIFALVAATIIRLFFVEAYVIPSGSMEKSLLIGDYLFVSKVSYGPKLPNTPISFPLVHNTMPLSNGKSFTTWIECPYKRLAGFGEVERNDVVVFNFPNGDTVAARFPNDDYYSLVRKYGKDAVLRQSELIVRPVDKKDNYVKRCVAIAGDSLKVVHGNVFVNGEAQVDIPKKQYNYYIQTNGKEINSTELDKMGLSAQDWSFRPESMTYAMMLTDENLQKVKSFANVVNVIRQEDISDPLDCFPHDKHFMWQEDNYGPIWVPKKGETTAITIDNLPLYSRIIGVYEGNKLEVKDSTIYINGQPSTSYMFKMNYYFMMGDNRHNSLDSRFWGFVPEDHVVGKAWFIWFSSDQAKSFPGNIRWSRIFKGVS